MNNLKKSCLECKDEILGRSDKKFCSDYCRVSFHNRSNAQSSKVIRNINKHLRRNRKILMDLKKSGRSCFAKSYLTHLGFRFEFITSQSNCPLGTKQYFCYDLGYIDNDKNQIQIINKFESNIIRMVI